MTWPTNKASTTHVDSSADSIRESRADIKQNIDNTNDIIDTFNIQTPSDGDVLRYDSASSAFVNTNIDNFIGISAIQFDSDLDDTGTLNSTIYDGGFTQIGNTVSGVAIVAPDSAGQEYLQFQPGTYHIRTAYADFSGGGGNTVESDFKDLSDDSIVFSSQQIGTSTGKIYEVGAFVTFSVETVLYIQYTSAITQPPLNPRFSHPELIISKLA